MLKFVTNLNFCIVVFMTLAYFYQFVYTATGLVFRHPKQEPAPKKLHRFAALISARNESDVIAELVASLKKQNYPAELLDIYVLADNCTDDTAGVARAAGAIVYKRWNQEQVGKGYALDYLLAKIKTSGRNYDAFFIFDADNIVDANFVCEMNKTFDRGYEILTCYRNSKNFGANWISAGYSIWFLREARFLNFPRMLMGNSCAVSGTGFMVSNAVVEKNGGWPFHLLTEDIQFSTHSILEGYKIGYCDRAMVYDEQPTSFSQSWNQRLRWSKGFYQVDAQYLGALAKGTIKKKGNRFSCYDMMMTVAPGMLLTLAVLIFNAVVVVSCFTQPDFITYRILKASVRYLSLAMVNFYVGLVLYALLTVISEWKRIEATTFHKLIYIGLFPIFMATYIPISLVALVRRVEWKPIKHFSNAMELSDAHRS